MAITSLLLSNGLQDLIPGSEANLNPNDPADPAAQLAWNHAAIQVGFHTGNMSMPTSGQLCSLQLLGQLTLTHVDWLTNNSLAMCRCRCWWLPSTWG